MYSLTGGSVCAGPQGLAQVRHRVHLPVLHDAADLLDRPPPPQDAGPQEGLRQGQLGRVGVLQIRIQKIHFAGSEPRSPPTL